MKSPLTKDRQKEVVGSTAIDRLVERRLLHSNMTIGLGTGTTVYYAIKRLATYITTSKITDIKIVATSIKTQDLCSELGINTFSFRNKTIKGTLDLTIDGADEIDNNNNLIKGGGAALLREKILAYNSKEYVIIADESKLVDKLGIKFPLPVEFISEAYISVMNKLQELGAIVTLREGVKKCGPVISDSGNQILDCQWNTTLDVKKMEDTINMITGVVENGFFTKKTPLVYYSNKEGNVIER